MKIDILCNYWDDPRGLMRLFESTGLSDITNTIHILDGKYIDHDGTPEYLQDLTQSVISNYNQGEWNGKINYRTISGLTQVQKRNKLWEYVTTSNPDYVIVLDSDEYVKMFTDLFLSQLYNLEDSESYCFDLEAVHMGTDYKLPRLFKKHGEWNMRHPVSHGDLWDMTVNRDIIDDRHKQDAVPGLRILHDKLTRSENRIKTDKKYRTIPDH